MGYNVAISKSWQELESATKEKTLQVNFLADEYSVDLENKKVLSLSCNVPAKDYITILVLHYLIKQSQGLPLTTGEWVEFRQLEGGQGYYPTFKKRVVDTIVRKYGKKPEAILDLTKRFKARRHDIADFSVVLDAFDNVPILIELWKADEEFGLGANILFDKTIKDIFCTEDIVVLSEFIVHRI